MIFYNQDNSPQRIRFTLAHELGHILLKHPFQQLSDELFFTARNTEPSEKDAPIEREANIFASRLLAPSCVLHELGLSSPEEIALLCDISLQSAIFRFKRHQLLEQRNRQFLQTKGFGCYYQHPLEKETYKQFKDFIRTHTSL